MISNKEKRLSHAHEIFPNLESPFDNSIHPTSYGLINNNVNLNPTNSIDDPFKKNLIDRNSHSLSHDFSQIYVSNLKNRISSYTQGKKPESSRHEQLLSLEQMNSYKKEANEAKKQLLQMEKSITYWSDCTEYWRNKWRKVRDEKNKSKDEIKQLKCRISRLEHQLQVSEDKRVRLNDEVHMLNEELSRYMCRFEEDNNNSRHRSRKNAKGIGNFNSDRRVDYRKHRRKKEIEKYEHKKHESSSSEEKDLFENENTQLVYDDNPNLTKAIKEHSNQKIIYRNHERLFDKKIMNRKRFSQVVMVDEDEIFQLNQEIPSSQTKNNDNQHHNQSSINLINNDSINHNTSHEKILSHQRFMGHLPEEELEDEEEDKFKRNTYCADFSTNQFTINSNIVNHSNLSTMATNSQGPNIGSMRVNVDDDDDSFKVDNQTSEDIHESDPDEV